MAALRDRHPGTFIQAWAAVDPLQGRAGASREAEQRGHASTDMLGFHFHPIMGHFAVDDPALIRCSRRSPALEAPVMIDVGTTGMGAGHARRAWAPGSSTPSRWRSTTWPPDFPA